MPRLILLFLLIAGIWWFSRWLKRQLTSHKKAPEQAQALVKCAYCNLHIPASEAISDSEHRSYCCPEHRDAWHARQD